MMIFDVLFSCVEIEMPNLQESRLYSFGASPVSGLRPYSSAPDSLSGSYDCCFASGPVLGEGAACGLAPPLPPSPK